MDWKFWLIDVCLPIATFIGGFFTGKTVEKKSYSKIKNGNNNIVVQNSNFNEK